MEVARKGDSTTGHGTYPSQTITGGSPDVTVNGIPVARQGDAVSTHCNTVKPFDCHGGSISGGSSTVTVNGKPVARKGDSIGCGGAISQGSGNVSIG